MLSRVSFLRNVLQGKTDLVEYERHCGPWLGNVLNHGKQQCIEQATTEISCFAVKKERINLEHMFYARMSRKPTLGCGCSKKNL